MKINLKIPKGCLQCDEHTYLVLKQWLDTNSEMPIMTTVPYKFDIGFHVIVLGQEIPEKLFPDEYNQILEALKSVQNKLKEYNNEREKI